MWLRSNPDIVWNIERTELERCLVKAEVIMRDEPALLEFEGKTVFVGDTHGDFMVTKEVAKQFFKDKTQRIVFLGDYVDRAPEDVGTSVPNICYLLFLKCAFPNNIMLLKGNHEANYAIPCFPYEFGREVEARYPGLHQRFIKVFAQMPLMALTNNVFASHGGILRGYGLEQLRAVDKNDVGAIDALSWSDPVISNTNRGAGVSFSALDVKEFLKRIGAKVFVRGHDYNTLGMAIYDDTCLTLFTSRRYRNMGNKGILIARANHEISAFEELVVEEYTGEEWKAYRVKSRQTFPG